jgi:hypothetical protein
VIKELTEYAFNAGRFAEKLEAFNRDVERLLRNRAKGRKGSKPINKKGETKNVK